MRAPPSDSGQQRLLPQGPGVLAAAVLRGWAPPCRVVSPEGTPPAASRPPASCLVASEGQATPHASSTCGGTCRGQTPRRQRGRRPSLSRAPSHVGGAVVCEIHLSALSLPSLGSLSQFKLPLTPKSDPGPQPQQVPGGIPPATCISEPSCKARLSPGPLTICRSEGPRPPPRGH